MSLTRKQMPSPNYSNRYGGPVRLIVIHSTEGATTIESLGNWFGQTSSQVSSHTGIDNANNNTIGEYVKPKWAAWTAGNANGVAIQTELCCPSGASDNWSTQDWKNHPHMLRKCADWIAEEASRYGIPITALNNSQAQGGGRGVCQHKNLGEWGGGHHDCGPNFPMQYVLDMAKGKPPAAPPEPEVVIGMFYLADVKNSPVALVNEARRVRVFCNTTEVQIDVDFIGVQTNNKTLRTSYEIGPAGADIPDECNALVLRRGDPPAGGYPLVSVEVLT